LINKKSPTAAPQTKKALQTASQGVAQFLVTMAKNNNSLIAFDNCKESISLTFDAQGNKTGTYSTNGLLLINSTSDFNLKTRLNKGIYNESKNTLFLLSLKSHQHNYTKRFFYHYAFECNGR
jgi:hypothetical protein